MIKREDIIKIGKFNKPHGIQGELSFSFTDDVFDRSGCPYVICEIDGIFVPFFIEEYRFRGENSALMKLEDIDTEEDARPFTNADVYFPKSYYIDSDTDEAPGDYFIGFTVVDEMYGMLGKIIWVNDDTANVLFVLEREGKELLIPAIDEFVTGIDEEKKILNIRIPEGLLDL